MHLCIYFIFVFLLFLQYVSALRPPKHSNKTDEDRNKESGGVLEGRRRVFSLTHQGSAMPHRYEFPRRSLHNVPLNSQLNWSVEEELKKRRRLAGFDQSYRELKKLDSDSDPESGEVTETDEVEWKQVSHGEETGSQ